MQPSSLLLPSATKKSDDADFDSNAASFGALDNGVEGKDPADFGAALLRSSVDRNDSTSS